MKDLLLVSRDRRFRESCRTALRPVKLRLLIFDDILDGMKELNWYQVKLMIWDMEPQNIREMKALAILRERYPELPLTLVLGAFERRHEFTRMANAVLSKSDSVKDIAKVARKLVSNRVSSRPEPG